MRIAVVTLLLVWSPFAWAQDNGDRARVLALERLLSKTILQAEPAIACILVSRSDAYHHVFDKDHPGRLGEFDPTMIKGLTEKDAAVRLKQLDLAHPAHVPQAFGSGVVIDASGLVLTNYHVVLDATKVYVRLPGGKGSYANIHAADPRSDLAVLKLIHPVVPHKTLPLGDADKLERGHFVLTLANPFADGFRDGQPSASAGILSNIRRRVVRHFKEEERIRPLQFYGTLLQTDARLHLGSSGGAMLNMNGEMVGLITATAAIQGGETPGGFAIPINAGMRRIIEVLKRGEEVDYGFLGVGFNDRGIAGERGITLTTVGKGSPAKLDGKLEKGDVLLAVNGQPITDTDDIYVNISTHLAGSKIRLLVQHGNREREALVTLAKLHVPGKPIVSSLGGRPYFRGLRVDYTSLAIQRFDHVPPGVLISEVLPNTSADRANLKSGDIVSHVNGQPIANPAGFYQAVADARGPVALTMYSLPLVDPPVRVVLK